jgi:geranylgeranyl reductase family protein
MKRFDAIVVGAGPAGSTTAYRLATAGARVLLLDRARFPRDKPCGGGVTLRAVRELPFSIDPVVEQVVSIAELRLGFKRTAERGRGPLAYMTQRRRLDHFLVEKAVGAGVDFRDGAKVSGVMAENGGVVVSADGETFAGEALVGADGVNGVSARSLELGGNKTIGVALEANVPNRKIDAGRYRDRFVLELGTVPGGYGWVFPKGDHVNVGVGGWDTQGPHLRTHLEDLCREHEIRLDDLEEVRGYRLPCRKHDSQLARGRALVVGDAGGLIDPLTGDGMFEAFLSGRFAAGEIRDLLAGKLEALDGYGTRLTRHLAVHLWASWSLKAALDRYPRTAFALAISPPVWAVVEKLVTGEIRDIRAARGLARAPLKVISLLARTAGDPGAAFRSA